MKVRDDKDVQRAVRYCENQRSFYIDEQDEHARSASIVFLDGAYSAPADEKLFHDFMAIHPDNEANGGVKFFRIDHAKEAKKELDLMDKEDEARDLARDLTLHAKVAILKAGRDKPETVDLLSNEEVSRDIRVMAKRDPYGFLELVHDSSILYIATISAALEDKVLFEKKFTNYTEIHKKYGDKKIVLKVDPGTDTMDALCAHFNGSKEGREAYIELESAVYKD